MPWGEKRLADNSRQTHRLKGIKNQKSKIKNVYDSLVPAELDFAAVLPAEDNPLGINHDQLARDETRVLKFSFGNLSFTPQCLHIGPPCHGTGRYVIISRNFNSFKRFAFLCDTDHFIEMSGIKTNPLTCKANCIDHDSNYLYDHSRQ